MALRFHLDTNIFVYATEADNDTGTRARQVLRQIEDGELEAVTSEITLAEVLRGGNALLNAITFDGYIDLLSARRGLQVLPISRDILIGSARLKVERKIDLTDAIHVSTALAAGCGAFLTEDVRLPVPAGLKKMSLIEHVGAL